MNRISLIVFGIALLTNNLQAQTTLYKTTDGLLMTEENYLKNKEEMTEREDLKGRYQEIFIKTEKRNDTIIKIIKFEAIPFSFTIGKNKGWHDPYAELRKTIGNHFPIESFKDESGNHFSTEYLKGKPTIVNFWFTNCPPCIEEIPDLHQLKEKYSTSVNFIAITFDSRKIVNKFLEKKPNFDYLHITNSQRQINRLNITSYPITFLLNKEGEMLHLYGGSIVPHKNNIDELLNLLL